MRVHLIAALGLTLALATACSSAGAPPAASTPVAASPAPAQSPAPAGSNCAADYLAKLTPRQKLAQLLTVGVTGTADALNVVRTEQVGGIFIGGWTDQGIFQQSAQVKAAAKVPLMVTIDEEGGRVSRVRNLIGPEPAARQVAKTRSAEQTYQQARERSLALKKLGVTVNFAPDIDVSSQPDNTVIGDRSFSSDPAVVTKYADATIRGMREAGIGAVIKHFPGHGSGSGDSHTGKVTTPSLERLKAVDLVPFRALANSGAAAMMGHLDVPGLTAPDVPASISPQAIALLRNGVGYGAAPFTGPIFTDDLSGMAAITSRLDIAGAVEAALVAGADNALWISTKAVPQVLNRLEQAVTAGRLSTSRVDESVLRMARYKGALTC